MVVLVGPGGVASADTNGPGLAFGYGSTWTYTSSAPADGSWVTPSFDASTWASASAPFSDASPGDDVYCSADYSDAGLITKAGTGSFPLDSTIYLRKSFDLPANAFGLHLLGTIDNNADVYTDVIVNGSTPNSFFGGNCDANTIVLDVPNAALTHGGTNVVAVKASDHGVATYFDMQASYGAIQFAQQPTETQQGSAMSPAPTVTITDAEGNPVSSQPVTLQLQTINGTGVLSGTLTEPTDDSGVATFSDLSVSASGEYRLVASSGNSTVTSNGFLIADQIAPCTGSCSAAGSNSGTTLAASASNAGGSLAVSVFAGASPPAGVCGSFVSLGATAVVSALDPGSTTPSFDITWTLDKSLVKQAPNPGAAHFDICLGAEDLEHPDGAGVTGWTTKSGTPATPVADDVLGATLFWGILPDCAKHGTPTGPCVLHRNKNHGNEVIEIYKPYPWDGKMFGG